PVGHHTRRRGAAGTRHDAARAPAGRPDGVWFWLVHRQLSRRKTLASHGRDERLSQRDSALPRAPLYRDRADQSLEWRARGDRRTDCGLLPVSLALANSSATAVHAPKTSTARFI